MSWLRATRVILRLFKEIGEDDISGAAAELAYKSFLALFPFLIFLAALGGFASDLLGVGNPTDEVMDTVGTSLPPDAASLLREQVDSVIQSRNTALLSAGIIGAIWAASSGVGTIMKSMNRVYEVKETRSLSKRYGVAVGLTLLAGGFLICTFVLLVVGQIYGTRIAEELGVEGHAALLLSLARWPVAVALLLTAVAFLLWAAPNVDLPFRWISPGALFFVLVWLPATYLFGLYVANFGSYGETYGALGGVVVLLVWLYLSSFILLFAAELNSVLAQQASPKELHARAGKAAAARIESGGRAARPAHNDAEVAPAPDAAMKRYDWLMVGILAAIAVWSTVFRRRPARLRPDNSTGHS